ncbi:MAG TPA: TRAP transporter small permease [Gammaproteobacteria bacterium]|nr:TRAP transporter small permease [Gammaproteobacteria bacterium]
MRTRLEQLNQKLQQLETALAATSLFLLLTLSVAQILIRNFLDFGYPEIDIINRHLLVICGLSGAALASARASHIKTDALNILLSARAKQLLHPWLQVFASMVCLALAYFSVIFVMDEWQYLPVNERWTLPFIFIYPLGFILMGIHFAIHFAIKAVNTPAGEQ